ncbi:MAG: DUF3054 domain-containing protein [Dermatophilaceae bacterium]
MPAVPRPTPTTGVGMPVAALIDLVAVLVFAAVGRASHAEDNAVAGALVTALPFLVGTAAGWALVRWRSGCWPLTIGTGIPVWFCTLVVGMLLRVVFGAGTALSFLLVAGVVLAVLLLGWRVAAEWLARRRAS